MKATSIQIFMIVEIFKIFMLFFSESVHKKTKKVPQASEISTEQL